MGRNVRSSRRMSDRRKKRTQNFEKEGVEPRRSGRITTNAFATKRLTIPVGFFAGGIKSTASRKTDQPHLTDRTKLVLNEDLHALLRDFTKEAEPEFGRDKEDFPAISGETKTEKARGRNYDTVSSYYYTEFAAKRAPEGGNKGERGAGKCLEEDVTGTRDEFLWDQDLRSNSHTTRDKTLRSTIQDPDESLPTTEEHHLTSINRKFAAKLQAQLKLSHRNHRHKYTLKVRLTANRVNDVLDGKLSARLFAPLEEMSTKRCLSEEYEELPSVPLVPQSQWVYNTPDKRIVKRFVFEDRADKMVPGVIQTTKKTKVLYDIKNEVVQNVNLNRYKDESVPIDKRFLNVICQTSNSDEESTNAKKKQKLSAEKENFFDFKTPFPAPSEPSTSFFNFQPNKDDFNVFLSNTEETIDIKPPEIPMDINDGSEDLFDPADPFEKAPINYQHQLLLATQRPSKTAKRIPKRHMLKGKSLSFENTPPRASLQSFEPKKLELTKSFEDCLDTFESEFNMLGEGAAATPSPETPSTPFQNFAVPTFKFYPRRNFDYKQ